MLEDNEEVDGSNQGNTVRGYVLETIFKHSKGL